MMAKPTPSRLLSLAAVAAALAVAGGCAPTPPPPAPPPRIEATAADYDRLIEAIERTLGEYCFTIDHIDRRAGLVETLPLTGMSWAEPWRRDGATLRDITESTLQTIYRRARVRIVRNADDTYALRVRVAVARADRPSLQITNVSQAYRLFSLERGALAARRGGPPRPVPLGEDETLAMFIRRDIEATFTRLKARPAE